MNYFESGSGARHVCDVHLCSVGGGAVCVLIAVKKDRLVQLSWCRWALGLFTGVCSPRWSCCDTDTPAHPAWAPRVGLTWLSDMLTLAALNFLSPSSPAGHQPGTFHFGVTHKVGTGTPGRRHESGGQVDSLGALAAPWAPGLPPG